MSDLAIAEQVLVKGDLSKLDDGQRLIYYNKYCETLGLNPITRPFEYITLQGKLMLYARKDATEQLRKLHNVSLEIIKREIINGVYIVTARATLPDGRYDESIGAVTLPQSAGDAYANAIMKCETKAKRRVTLSIVGLGLLDETEIETIPPSARQVPLTRSLDHEVPFDKEILTSICQLMDDCTNMEELADIFKAGQTQLKGIHAPNHIILEFVKFKNDKKFRLELGDIQENEK